MCRYEEKFPNEWVWAGIAYSVQRLPTGLTVRGRIPVGANFLYLEPTQVLYNGTGPFPGIKRSGSGVNYPPHLVPTLKKE
jgi:hypothetical protein